MGLEEIELYLFKTMKEKHCQLDILYIAKIFFLSASEIKTFLDKQKLKEFVASRPHTIRNSQRCSSG